MHLVNPPWFGPRPNHLAVQHLQVFRRQFVDLVCADTGNEMYTGRDLIGDERVFGNNRRGDDGLEPMY